MKTYQQDIQFLPHATEDEKECVLKRRRDGFYSDNGLVGWMIVAFRVRWITGTLARVEVDVERQEVFMSELTKREVTFEQIEAILNGIDRDELESDDGWWETSTGAERGAKKLAEIKALFYPPKT